ncbi:ribulose-phosphate 3-epimerase [Caproiciproducens sp. CPB-2]|uniref:ribulose-phosphate 3-epimerase n=1 Tax=Caproiciproducens sp. CPB-2 TaxID=3030017 RepID=UPI0023DC3617|nr:ribulose-phosphate 3-epimerase [Caproiciproducens sp. CPB-2]MDF1494470.1 ribulose-phosphate 3-epimerase [Caproiciproducens sp. CPB-2]
MLIAPSVLSSDFSQLGNEVRRMDLCGADWIHLDVMDGHFVPNLTFGAPVIRAVRGFTEKPFDVHLMIDEPLRYVPDFLDAGADIITFHIESKSDTEKTLKTIRAGGAKPALSVKPGTPAETLFPYLDKLYMVLVMTVEPGFGGQRFMEDMMEKIRTLKARRPELLVQVDGGINPSTIRTAAQAGADVCVAGTSVFKAENAAQAIRDLKAAAGQK